MAYSIPITLLILSTSLEMGKGCFSSGVCGNAGSYGCPQPIAPVCSGGCSSGYSCGQYGCYARARARSPKILDDMVIDSPINDDVALRPNTKVCLKKKQKKELSLERTKLYIEEKIELNNI